MSLRPGVNGGVVAHPLRGKVVVAGAGSGIGAATARLAAEQGALVWSLDRRLPSPPYGHDGCTDGDGGGSATRTLDVTDASAWAELAVELRARHGTVNGLVNCAGTTWRARLPDLAGADLARVHADNVGGPLLGIQALLPLMPRGASVVNVGSLAGLTGHYAVACTTSKWALRGLTHAACLELGPRGVRVNAVHPGFIETPMTSSAAEGFRTAALGQTPLGPAGRPEELAAVIAFLLGDGVAFVSGAEIAVDGGSSSQGGSQSVSEALRQSEPEPSLSDLFTAHRAPNPPDDRAWRPSHVRVLPRQLRLEPRRGRHLEQRGTDRRGRPRLPADPRGGPAGRGRRHRRVLALLDRGR